MIRLFVFGLGYSASRIAEAIRAGGGVASGVGRAGFADADLSQATHILSSVPPGDSGDPVLARYADAIRASRAAWIGYLSSTGVYGDTGGAWVDEASPVGGGRRSERSEADAAWQALDPRVHVFRLPGIYGPGRSPLDRMLEVRVDAPAAPVQPHPRRRHRRRRAGVDAGPAPGRLQSCRRSPRHERRGRGLRGGAAGPRRRRRSCRSPTRR